MPSQSLALIQDGIEEVRDIQRGNPTPTGSVPRQPEITRAIGRASVVILSSHFEGFIYALNLESASVVNSAGIEAGRLPETLRLVHAKPAVDRLASASWEGPTRAQRLADFVSSDAWLWGMGGGGRLEGERLLMWMKSPTPEALIRHYRYWGIENIFDFITRSPRVRGELVLRVKELVEKRNAIAHGDPAVEATQADVGMYIRAVARFAERTDRAMARQLSRLCRTTRPW